MHALVSSQLDVNVQQSMQNWSVCMCGQLVAGQCGHSIVTKREAFDQSPKRCVESQTRDAHLSIRGDICVLFSQLTVSVSQLDVR